MTDRRPASDSSDPTADNPGGSESDQGPGVGAARPARPHDAASLILWRDGPRGPEVLMGLRHARHRFMPNVLVFPGGRVDREDRGAPATSDLRAFTRACLERRAAPELARALGVAAARELLEETGLALGRLDGGRLLPDLAALDYLCRAVTPAAMPIRFNARFLIARAEAAGGAVRGSGELEELRFFALDEASAYRLATITAKILDEFRGWLAMSPAEREARELVCFRGMDNRLPEL